APDRLRFDFNHFSALSREDIKAVEEEVNRMVLANLPVKVEVTSIDVAKEKGATALFADKYEEEVRMVSAGEYTRELCGGTHVSATGKIGLFKVVSEEGIGSGLRRIEATAGMISYRQTVERDNLIAAIADDLNTSENRLEEKVRDYITEHRQLQKQNQELKHKMAGLEVNTLTSTVKEIDGVNLLSAKVEADSIESLRMIMDEVKGSISSVLVVLGAVSDGKVILVGSASPDLVKRGIHANKIIREVASRVGGGGGGKPELAQAGGKDPAALPEALSVVEEMVREILKV
ncbi:MAG: alanine--tRNA ligase, partial [Firmicutes bacterium]|nr:alanine--tRNA ligase [Bacillota bacterium]